MKPVDDFLDEVSRGLFDPTYAVWTKDELLGYTKDGLGELMKYAPEQFTETITVTCVTGPHQDLPASAVTLLNPLCNVAGGVQGREIRLVNYQSLGRADPSWRSATAASTIKELAVDPLNPRKFFVVPPAIASTQILLTVLQEPSVDLADDLPIDGRYNTALFNFVLFRALSKDHDYAIPGGRAAAFYEAFLTEVNAGGTSQ